MRPARWHWLAVVVAALALAALPAKAQLSPGELSRAHAELEGSANCLRCHQARKGVDPDLCLSCHEELARRIEARLGLHARLGYERCERCHIEHHGREFDLIWWGDEGRDGFDHSLTGFALEGAHARGDCGDCHHPGAVADPARLEAAGKDLSRTFLGLDRSCLACHDDAHRGQVTADGCAECHGFEAWAPPAAFDHGRTSFPLTGLHGAVACTSCHQTLPAAETGEPASRLRFAVDRFALCSDCHRDPHQGRLGGRCESCHSTSGWSRFDRRAFDHGRTRFALTGAHLEVACDACHRQGAGLRIERFERCDDCHRDEHLNQFASRAADDGCRSCHTVEAFVPATFTLGDHQRSSFPLEGAHLAIPCIGCHREIGVDELRGHFAAVSPPADGSDHAVRQFRFGATGCRDCHADPHGGEPESGGCESCHEVSSWRTVSFDHDATALPLRGEHAELGCRSCHARDSQAGTLSEVRFGDLSAACSSCHEDPHLGQFAAIDATASCVRCHDERSWTEVSFDHDRDARFRLEGAHLRLACGECHPTDSRAGRAFIRYRPLGRTCEACHAVPPGDGD